MTPPERPIVLRDDEIPTILGSPRGRLLRPFRAVPHAIGPAGAWAVSAGRRGWSETNMRCREVRDRRTGVLLERSEYLVPFDEWLPTACPFAAVGQLLWGRERWAPAVSDAVGRFAFYAVPDHCCSPFPTHWRSRLHMPRWAARILLDVGAVSFLRPDESGDGRWTWAVDWARNPGPGMPDGDG